MEYMETAIQLPLSLCLFLPYNLAAQSISHQPSRALHFLKMISHIPSFHRNMIPTHDLVQGLKQPFPLLSSLFEYSPVLRVRSLFIDSVHLMISQRSLLEYLQCALLVPSFSVIHPISHTLIRYNSSDIYRPKKYYLLYSSPLFSSYLPMESISSMNTMQGAVKW
jgi:hypothetical protein